MDGTSAVRLVVVDGPETGRVFTFEGADSFLVGRSPKGHLVLDPAADRYVSRVHCLIDIRPPRIILNDLGSTNGTFVNGRRIGRCEVHDGDEIRVGRTRIRIVSSPMGGSELGNGAPVGSAPSPPTWRPPEATGSWAPPAAAEWGDAPPPPACASCGRDLSDHADADGRAAELPDASYLCPECEPPAGDTECPPGLMLFDELGRGGMGVVHWAVELSTRRLVAVKQVLPDVSLDERQLRLFEREIVVHSSVCHRHLARFLDHGRVAGRPYLVVEYLGGGDATHLLRDVFKGPLPVPLAVRIGLEVLEGVAALHAAGFVHRDLKPRNILLARPPEAGFGAAKVTDYGLAKPFEDAGHSLFDLTRDNEAAGSLMFMPPEQILDYRHVQPPADVYAVGASLYFLLTGAYTVESPIHSYQDLDAGTPDAGPPRSPVEALIEDEPIPILGRRADLPRALAEVIDTAVAKDLSRRFASAAIFHERLAAAAELR